jgi:stringent starvation protein B
MLVDTALDVVEVPRAFVENGRIILNISPEATHSLVLGNEAVTFNARFSGTAMDVHVPVSSVLAIYARENGQGMMFGDQDDTPPGPGTDPGSGSPFKKPELEKGPTAPPETKRPSLKIVK